MSGTLFDVPDSSDRPVKCLGCKRWFRGLRELQTQPHAAGCERPGEAFR